MSHVAGFLMPEVPVYDPRKTVGPSNLLISNQQLGKALAETLGQNTVALIRGMAMWPSPRAPGSRPIGRISPR